MAHSLFRLTQRIYNTPQLISMSSMRVITEYLSNRNIGLISPPVNPEDSSEDDDTIYYSDYNIGIVPITGVLTAVPFEGVCGEEGVSYQSIVNDVTTLIAQGAKTIILEMGSNGGEAAYCFEAAALVKSLAAEANVKIITYVDSIAFSAAYAWASIADEVIMNPTAEVGSIGVVVQLTNYNKMLKSEGIETLYIFSGSQKVPFDAEGDWQEGFLSDIQDKVDVFYSDFVEFVAMNRNIPVQAIKDTEARTFLHKDAIKLGLADKVMTKADFTSYIFNRDE